MPRLTKLVWVRTFKNPVMEPKGSHSEEGELAGRFGRLTFIVNQSLRKSA